MQLAGLPRVHSLTPHGRQHLFMRTRILVTISLGLLLAGCLGSYSQNPPGAAAPAHDDGYQWASAVCADFVGSRIGTTTFNECVTYQQSRNPGQSVPPYRMDQYNNRVDAEGYRVDSTGRRMPVQNQYFSLRGQASSSQVILRDEQVILRDEYGNRYDSRGNRI